MAMRNLTKFLVVVVIVAATGCGAANRAVQTAVDRAATATGAAVGETVGAKLGEAASAMVAARFPANWTQQWTALYVNYLFSIAFHSGSYSVVEEAYEPGDWTRWRVVDEGEETPATVERAFLAETPDGNQWWRVKYVNTEDDEAIILEGLFDREAGEMLRLRGQFPGEEPKELPVTEGTYGYAEPIELTEASIEGATVGVESVSVPAGTFQARHVRYGTTGGTLEWWLEDDVPGHLVKYLSTSATDTDGAAVPASWTVELQAYGDNAESELGVL